MRRALLGAIAVGTLLAPGRVAAAALEEEEGARPLVTEALGGLSPELAGVEVDDDGYRDAYDAWQEAGERLDEAEAARRGAEGRLGGLRTRRDRLAEQLREDRRTRQRSAGQLEGARRSLVDLAVASFVGDDPTGGLHELFGDTGDEDGGRRDVLGDAAADERTAELGRASEALARAQAAEQATTAAFVAAEDEYEDVRVARERAADGAAAEERVRDDHVVGMAERAPSAGVAGTDLVVVVLDAYWRGQRDGPCPMPWPLLAGIGRIESRHGTSGTSEPDALGDVSPTIIGIPLDGSRNTAVIPDSDGGTLDGDLIVDRAVGPLQFIPSTWRSSGADGNGDGAADPNNLYDAALAAVRYLCRASGDQTDDAGLRRAVFSYNHSDPYVETVLSHADRYRKAGVALAPPVTAPANP